MCAAEKREEAMCKDRGFGSCAAEREAAAAEAAAAARERTGGLVGLVAVVATGCSCGSLLPGSVRQAAHGRRRGG